MNLCDRFNNTVIVAQLVKGNLIETDQHEIKYI